MKKASDRYSQDFGQTPFFFCAFLCKALFWPPLQTGYFVLRSVLSIIVMLNFMYIFTKATDVAFHLFIHGYDLDVNCYSNY